MAKKKPVKYFLVDIESGYVEELISLEEVRNQLEPSECFSEATLFSQVKDGKLRLFTNEIRINLKSSKIEISFRE